MSQKARILTPLLEIVFNKSSAWMETCSSTAIGGKEAQDGTVTGGNAVGRKAVAGERVVFAFAYEHLTPSLFMISLIQYCHMILVYLTWSTEHMSAESWNNPACFSYTDRKLWAYNHASMRARSPLLLVM